LTLFELGEKDGAAPLEREREGGNMDQKRGKTGGKQLWRGKKRADFNS